MFEPLPLIELMHVLIVHWRSYSSSRQESNFYVYKVGTVADERVTPEIQLQNLWNISYKVHKINYWDIKCLHIYIVLLQEIFCIELGMHLVQRCVYTWSLQFESYTKYFLSKEKMILEDKMFLIGIVLREIPMWIKKRDFGWQSGLVLLFLSPKCDKKKLSLPLSRYCHLSSTKEGNLAKKNWSTVGCPKFFFELLVGKLIDMGCHKSDLQWRILQCSTIVKGENVISVDDNTASIHKAV